MRKFNYTGRRPLDRKGIRIRLEPESQQGVRFLVERLEIPSERYDPAASVFVEAYYSNLFQRFNLGTVRAVETNGWRLLDRFPPSVQIKFRVKVVDESSACGLILADERQIRPTVPEPQEDRISLLEFQYVSGLGNQVWDLHFPQDGYPVFQINDQLEHFHVRQRLTSDPAFLSLIYPEIIRRVFHHYLLGDGMEEDDTSGDRPSPRSDWMRFGEIQCGAWPPVEEDDKEEIRQWISGVVDSFATQKRLLDKYMEVLEEESQ